MRLEQGSGLGRFKTIRSLFFFLVLLRRMSVEGPLYMVLTILKDPLTVRFLKRLVAWETKKKSNHTGRRAITRWGHTHPPPYHYIAHQQNLPRTDWEVCACGGVNVWMLRKSHESLNRVCSAVPSFSVAVVLEFCTQTCIILPFPVSLHKNDVHPISPRTEAFTTSY